MGLKDRNKYVIPTVIPDVKDIISISAGTRYSLLLRCDGKVHTFGHNDYGQMGTNSIENNLVNSLTNIVQLSAGYKHSIALTDDKQVYTFGYNYFGQLGLGDKIDRPVPTLITEFAMTAKL